MGLEFGTAGIRGIVGKSIDNLNEAHVARVFEAYARYIKNNFSHVKEKTIVIGRDNRIKGRIFSIIAVNILTSHGIKVFFNDEMLPTPFISFLVKHKKTLGAINITASHNPKEYNGIKLYNSHGFQMLPDEIMEIKKYFDNYEKYESYIDKTVEIINTDKILEITLDDYEYYINEVVSLKYDNKTNLSNLKIVYSPLHGTGYKFIKDIFDKLNINVIYEQNEIIEDEDFTFVSNPNPEFYDAYKNTIHLAIKENADLIIITDPDSDRVGVAYKENGEFKLINGNENAILITDYLLSKKWKENIPYYLVYSFVSTSLPSRMCQEHNIKSYITETGFKWIGKTIEENKGKENFFFAFEESYGSLVNETISLDKDAIQSAVLIAIIASEAKRENMNLNDKLKKIYSKYGYMKAQSFSFELRNKEQLESIKNKFKDIKFNNANFYDYNDGIRNIEPNDMISYEFQGTLNWVSLRPSGTEPKFKIYIHVVDNSEDNAIKIFNDILFTVKNKLNI
ncbi:MAG: phospho-sugar mutase [Mycoplasma sp.]|nr:phospho-sugar mutase [Mycoplasma sp.]